MLIHIYNKLFEKIGVVDNDLSLIWNRKYNRPDTFQITTNISKNVLDMLQDGNLIRKDGDNNLAYITYTEKDNTISDNSFIVKGFGFSNKLEGRYNEEYYYKTDTVVNHIKTLINNNIINPKNIKRRYPGFQLVIDESIGVSSEVPYKCEYGADILTTISELCDIDNLGYKVEFIDNIAKLIIYKGKNKTFEQDFNRPVLFSSERDNILGQRLVKESSNKKNVLLVIGQGEDDDKFIVEVGEEEQEGYDRFEGTINAQDIDPENEGDYLSIEEYKALLKQRGKKAIKEFKETISYDNEIHSGSNLEYKKDFDLGDLVDFENKGWGVKLQTRILGIEEVYEGSMQINITVGDELPTINSKIQQIEQTQNKPLPLSKQGTSSIPGEQGKPGIDGKNGLSIDYNWEGTRLGIKKENESVFSYVDLKGEIGPRGKDGLNGERGLPGRDGKNGLDGIDASVTKDKVIDVLGFVPSINTHRHTDYETSIANLEHSKASKSDLAAKESSLQKKIDIVDNDINSLKLNKVDNETLEEVAERVALSIPTKVSELTNDRKYLNDMLSYVKVTDTRNTTDKPSDFASVDGQKTHFAFKGIESVGNPPVQAHTRYVYVLTFAGWRDPSGGYPIQLAFGTDGLALRTGISDTEWSDWEKVANKQDTLWSNIEGKPSTFKPSSHTHSEYLTKNDISGLGGGDMLTATYDTNNNGYVDVAETIIVEENGVKFKAKYIIKNNIPHLEIVGRS